jgi:hypothetical protein
VDTENEKYGGLDRGGYSANQTGDCFTIKDLRPPNCHIKDPSAIIPQEFNYILNPLHPDHNNFKYLNANGNCIKIGQSAEADKYSLLIISN